MPESEIVTFTPSRRPRIGDAFASIGASPSPWVGLSAALMALVGPSWFAGIFSFNRERMQLLVKLLRDDETHDKRISILHRDSTRAARLCVSGYQKQFGLSEIEPGRYKAWYDETRRAIVIELTAPIGRQ